jgi:hypothetical protein
MAKAKKFTPHMMYSSKGVGKKANTFKDHLALKSKGYSHKKPAMKKK